MVDNLYQHSIDVILKHQHSSGSYLASPNFETYKYCWFRDGSFTAYAMDISGESHSADRFFHWSAAVINQRTDLIERAIEKSRRKEPLTPNEILRTRYQVDGSNDEGDWPNFQLDGYGTWLWALGEHKNYSSQPIADNILQAAKKVGQYLHALWNLPCYDCWEEFPDHIHLYTLGSIYAGLTAESALSGSDHGVVLKKIKELILREGNKVGYFPKFIGSNKVDGSLLALAVPYRLMKHDHPLMVTTVAKIESDLRSLGGVHRYDSDTYYGGGEWLLLTAWLAWYYLQAGKTSKADSLLEWVSEQADADGNLPEQVPLNLNDPSHYEPWLNRWGPIAKPLLWSHAKYLIASHNLRT